VLHRIRTCNAMCLTVRFGLDQHLQKHLKCAPDQPAKDIYLCLGTFCAFKLFVWRSMLHWELFYFTRLNIVMFIMIRENHYLITSKKGPRLNVLLGFYVLPPFHISCR
jgi:hypothetical protein